MFSNYSKRMLVLLQLMPQVFNWIAIRRLDSDLGLFKYSFIFSELWSSVHIISADLLISSCIKLFVIMLASMSHWVAVMVFLFSGLDH